MAQYGTWVSYGGTAKVTLAIVLLIAAAGLAHARTRLPLPARAPQPGQAAANFMLAAHRRSTTSPARCTSRSRASTLSCTRSEAAPQSGHAAAAG
jgi:hypothetical protein